MKDVYILEDHMMTALVLEKMVSEAGYTPRSFKSRNGFLVAVAKAEPYAAILDNFTPKFEDSNECFADMGYEVARELQAFHPSVRIAIHTSEPTKTLETLTGVHFFSKKVVPRQELFDYLNRA